MQNHGAVRQIIHHRASPFAVPRNSHSSFIIHHISHRLSPRLDVADISGHASPIHGKSRQAMLSSQWTASLGMIFYHFLSFNSWHATLCALPQNIHQLSITFPVTIVILPQYRWSHAHPFSSMHRSICSLTRRQNLSFACTNSVLYNLFLLHFIWFLNIVSIWIKEQRRSKQSQHDKLSSWSRSTHHPPCSATGWCYIKLQEPTIHRDHGNCGDIYYSRFGDLFLNRASVQQCQEIPNLDGRRLCDDWDSSSMREPADGAQGWPLLQCSFR